MNKKDNLLLFVDTEFTDFKEMDLISIGIVSIQNHKFYAENSNFRKDWCSEFVKEIIIPKLEGKKSKLSHDKIQKKIQKWISNILKKYKKVTFIYDYSGDWILLEKLLIEFKEMEKINKIKVNLDEKINEYFKEENSNEHHALTDAKILLKKFHKLDNSLRSVKTV